MARSCMPQDKATDIGRWSSAPEDSVSCSPALLGVGSNLCPVSIKGETALGSEQMCAASRARHLGCCQVMQSLLLICGAS